MMVGLMTWRNAVVMAPDALCTIEADDMSADVWSSLQPESMITSASEAWLTGRPLGRRKGVLTLAQRLRRPSGLSCALYGKSKAVPLWQQSKTTQSRQPLGRCSTTRL